ncbi:MAG: GtrA family protein [Rhizobiales bacterium]|nr:GtrA family protein [Hyphomicrobiales bacterium]
MRSLFQRLSKTWQTPATSLKMISFALVGLGNTVIDFGVFTLAYEFMKLPLIASNVAAWLVAVSGSYVANTMITFRTESGRVLRRRDYLTFVASGILGVVATTTTLVVLSLYLNVMVAKLVSILSGFIVNFTMSNFVVFPTRTQKLK